jgi:hypothetical protein
MASIHKRPDSKYWHGAWRATDGRLVLRSTKQTYRKLALSFAIECERAEKLAGADSLTEAQAREIIGDIMKRVGTGEALRCPSVRGYFREWLAGKAATKAAGTIPRYTKAVTEFLKHLADRADKPLSSLTSRQVESFVTMRSKTGLSPSTVTLDCKVIRTALNKARRQGLIASNPAEAIDLPANDAVERAAFTPAEVKMLVDAADGEWKTLIQLDAKSFADAERMLP